MLLGGNKWVQRSLKISLKFFTITRNMGSSSEAVLSAAESFISFVNKSPSPFHAVHEVEQVLAGAGFKEVKEADRWNIKPLDKCFVKKNNSTIIAFAVGGKYKPGNGFSIIGAHTDSPCLRVKPVSRKVKQGYHVVGVECYGGGSWHTWTDRDLKLAGRVLVRNGDKIDQRLLHIDRPIMRIPNIAIHLNREMGTKFEWNKETNLAPVLASAVQEELSSGSQSKEAATSANQADKHSPILVKLLCDELKVTADNLLDFELYLADHQPAAIGGALREFIFSPRLDNLHSTYCAMKGLVDSCSGAGLTNETNIRMISFFDNEECGSASAQGAGSMFQENVLRRLSHDASDFSAFERAIAKSVMVSADMAHAVHPNYPEKHEDQHRPDLLKGVVIKTNSNQRYATTAVTTAMLREVARKVDVPLQDFVVRNDSPCGSTIGPIMSSRLGMATIDVGSPQLSMHSIREMCGSNSVLQATTLFQAFFEYFPAVFASVNM